MFDFVSLDSLPQEEEAITKTDRLALEQRHARAATASSVSAQAAICLSLYPLVSSLPAHTQGVKRSFTVFSVFTCCGCFCLDAMAPGCPRRECVERVSKLKELREAAARRAGADGAAPREQSAPQDAAVRKLPAAAAATAAAAAAAAAGGEAEEEDEEEDDAVLGSLLDWRARNTV